MEGWDEGTNSAPTSDGAATRETRGTPPRDRTLLLKLQAFCDSQCGWDKARNLSREIHIALGCEETAEPVAPGASDAELQELVNLVEKNVGHCCGDMLKLSTDDLLGILKSARNGPAGTQPAQEREMKHFRYFKYLVRHKWFVFIAGLQTGAPCFA
jgi:hypothetical protein